MKKLLVAALLLSLGGVCWSATPSITSTTGTYSGQANDSSANIICLTGLNFSTKTPAAPTVWATFEAGSDPTNLGLMSSWDQNTSFYSTTTNQKSGSGKSVVGTWDSVASSRNFSFAINNQSTFTQVYMLANRYYDWAPTGVNNIKIWRLWRNNNSGYTPSPCAAGHDFVSNISPGGSGCSNECSASQQQGRFQGPIFSSNTWLNEEFFWTHGSTTSCAPGFGNPLNDGTWDYYRNGTRVQHTTNTANCELGLKGLRVIDNFTDSTAGHSPADGSHVWMDDVYVDTQVARVILASNSSLLVATQKAPLIPISWSDTQITAYFHQSDFDTAETAYLFVCNATNECSTGKEIQIGQTEGGGGDPDPAPNISGGTKLKLHGTMKIRGTINLK